MIDPCPPRERRTPPRDVPWQVFLGHTSDLADVPDGVSCVERVKQAVVRAGHVAVDMGLWSAMDMPPEDACREKLQGCDVYVVLLGLRYGSRPPGSPDRSYTELEFDVAGEMGIPRLAISISEVLAETAHLAWDDDRGSQSTFRSRVGHELTCARIEEWHEVELAAYQALVNLKERTHGHSASPPVFSRPPLIGPLVDRTELQDHVVRSLREAVAAPPVTSLDSSARAAVGITTALFGPGGLGKTTLALLVAHDPEVCELFPDGIVWVTLGRAEGAELVGKVNELSGILTGSDPPSMTDPISAGSELARRFAARRMLLILDDVWMKTQLAPFLNEAPNVVRLITTRRPSVLPERAAEIEVGAMSDSEARSLLTRDLPPLARTAVAGVLDVTGRWPLLLAQVRAAVRADFRRGQDPTQTLIDLCERLSLEGPAILDITDAGQQQRALTVTYNASLKQLTHPERERFLELAIFGEDTRIPLSLLERFWGRKGRFTAQRVRDLCAKLDDLALAILELGERPRLRLHDVTRAWLRHEHKDRLVAWHRAFLDAHRRLVPIDVDGGSAWWRLPATERYLWAALPNHLRDADRSRELTRTVTDIDWVLGVLQHRGPAVLESQLAMSPTGEAAALLRVIRQNAHGGLLAPLEPEGSLRVVLASRVPVTASLVELRRRLMKGMPATHLWPTGTRADDLAHPALVRVLAGATEEVSALAVAPSDGWLASADRDGAIQLWHPTSGTTLGHLQGECRGVSLLAAHPEGAWLAVAGQNGRAELWTAPATRAAGVTSLTGHTRPLSAFAVPGTGAWLAGAGLDGTIMLWHPDTDEPPQTLTGHRGPVTALAAGPQGDWLVSAGIDRTVRLWPTRGGQPPQTLAVTTRPARALAVDPAGAWIAAPAGDDVVGIWDGSGRRVRDLPGHDSPPVAVTASTGTWLAVACASGRITIWDTTSWTIRHTVSLPGRDPKTPLVSVTLVAGNRWLAVADQSEIRVWNAVSGRLDHTFDGHTSWVTDLIALDAGRHLASSSDDHTIRLWDPSSPPTHYPSRDEDGQSTSTPRRPAATRNVPVTAMATDLQSTWVATGDTAGVIAVRGLVSGTVRHALRAHAGDIVAMAPSPDGRWIATAGADGQTRIVPLVEGALSSNLPLQAQHLTVTPDGNWLIVADTDGVTHVVNPTTGRDRDTFAGNHSRITALRCTPGPQILTGDAEGTLQVSDLFRTSRTVRCAVGSIAGIAVSVPMNVLVVVGPHGWQSHPLNESDNPAPPAAHGHHSGVVAAALDESQGLLATAEHDGVVRLWDIATGGLLRELIGHHRTARAVAYGPGDAWLASAGEDGTVRIWDPGTGNALAAIRVDARLQWLAVCGDRIVAAGDRGPYVFTLHQPPRVEIDLRPTMSLPADTPARRT